MVKDDRHSQRPPEHSRKREDLHTLWLKSLRDWQSAQKQELLGRMLYKEFFAQGVLNEEAFGFKVETSCDGTITELRHGHDYDYGNLPSLWYSPKGLCGLIEGLACEREISPEQFMASLFKERRAEQILRKLFRDAPSTAKSPSGN